MDMSLYICLTVPAECAVRKINMNTLRKQVFPEYSYLFTLRDRVSGNQSRTNRCTYHKISGFLVPTGNIVKIAIVFHSVKNSKDIFFLLCWHKSCTYKRRITHNIRQLICRNNLLPIQPQSIPLNDISISFQRQEVNVTVDNIHCFCQHLRLCYPERGFRNRHRKIVYLNTVELLNRHLNRVGSSVPQRYLRGQQP